MNKKILLLIVSILSATLLFAQAPTNRQLSRLGLKNAKVTALRNGIWKVSVAGKQKGHVVSSAPFAANVSGFKGATPVLVYINSSKKIEKIIALPNQDTPEFFSSAEELFTRWKNQKSNTAAKMKVDAVSGATYSSRGIIGNVRAAIEAYNKYVK
ncbi:MAG: FMN-binding protein [Alloprevotella sp.]|nr:FMN-binding protein [Alloprevotella sp.]